MAVEIPSSLIRRIQDVLRKQADIPARSPSDPALPSVPSFEDAVSGLDPSVPTYLRCKECRAALLRGLQSTVCVFCGAEQRKDPPMSISFNGTLSCRKLLQSLDLDGSEVVSLNTESQDSGKDRAMGKDGMLLSSLLDLELRWPHEEEKIQSSSMRSAPTTSTLTLAGVDLDSFFTNTGKLVSSNASGAPEEMTVKGAEAEDFGLFEELRHTDKAVNSVETKPSVVDDSSGVWEAEFQSANFQVSSVEPYLKDYFQDPLNAAVVEQLKTEPGMNIEDKEREISDFSNQTSSNDDSWPLDGLWHTSDSVVTGSVEHFAEKDNAGLVDLKPNVIDDGWAHTGPCPPTGGKELSSAAENMASNDDSFDDWQEFSGSGNVPDALSSSRTNEHELGVLSMSVTERPKDMDFGSFIQSDMLSRLPDIMKDFSTPDEVQTEASIADRMHGREKKEIDARLSAMSERSDMLSSRQSAEHANATVQDLLSQMHDLSFMLEDKLCIPKKVDPSD